MVDHGEKETLGELVRVRWLEAERAMVWSVARSAGVPASVEILEPQATVDPAEENRVSTGMALVRVSPFTIPALRSELKRRLEGARFPNSPAESLLRRFGDRCNGWSFGPPSFETQPREWIETRLLAPTRLKYLSRLESIDTSNEPLAAELARSLLTYFSVDRLTHVTWLPLGGLRLPTDPFNLGPVTFRRLTPGELGALHDQGPMAISREVRRHQTPLDFDYRPERWALEVREEVPKLTQPIGSGLAKRFVLALQLLGFAVQGRGASATWTEPGPTLYNGGQTFKLVSRRVETRECRPQEVERALRLAERIEADAVQNPRSRPQLALHRFLRGVTDDHPADAVIDFAIALEAVLLPDRQEGEMSYRFRLFGARFLEQDSGPRRSTARQLSEVYSTRSKLVHGGKPPEIAEVQRVAIVARDLAARVLVRCLEVGWPTAEALSDEAFGS